ncbi:MAG: hypothetical protein V3U98_02535 [Acidobacteriota bacterium]
MMIGARLVVSCLLVALLGTGAWAQAILERWQSGREIGGQLMYLPNGRYLKVASLGYAPLLADLIYLWSIQYYGAYDREVRYDIVEHVYVNVIGELDPLYSDAFLLGSLILSVEAQAPERALAILDAGMERNPDDWILPFEAGFVAYNQLGDFERAARYYQRCATIPGAHPVARRYHAEMFNKMGDRETSYAKWLEVYETAEDDFVRDVAYTHVHDLRIEIDVEALQVAVEIYRENHGRYPAGLRALVGAGLIQEVAVDPEGEPYTYNPSTGEVGSRSKYRLWRR